MQLLYLKYRLIIVTICAKLFKNPLKYEEGLDRTQNIPYSRLCKSLRSKCDLDLEGRDAGVAHDISAYYSDYLCQLFSKSFDL
jgi:hypothetical protein